MRARGAGDVLINVLVPTAAWFAVFAGSRWATNLTYFFACVASFGIVWLFVPDDRVPPTIVSNPAIPEWLSNASDVLTLIPLVLGGWWWCAAATFGGWLGCRKIWDARALLLEGRRP